MPAPAFWPGMTNTARYKILWHAGITISLFCLLLFGPGLSFAASSDEVSAECNKHLAAIYNRKTSPAEKEKARSSSHIKSAFIWENDAFPAFDQTSDRQYTNGIKLSWTHNPCKYPDELSRDFLGWILTSTGYDENDNIRHYYTGASFGMNMYAPNDETIATRQTDDRPYAGWLYGGLIASAIDSEVIEGEAIDKSIFILEMQLGVIGPKAGQREAQDFIHRNIASSRLAEGWDNQIEGQIGVNINFLYREKEYLFNTKKWHGTWHAGINVGNVVNYINAGAILSFGRQNNEFPILPITPVFKTEKPNNQRDDYHRDDFERDELYVFIGSDYRFIATSIFIDGKGLSSHDIELVSNVFDYFVGIAYKPANKTYKVSYKMIKRSKEFETRNLAIEDTHNFGQLAVELYY